MLLPYGDEYCVVIVSVDDDDEGGKMQPFLYIDFNILIYK
jgi:hypothetical protein